MSSSRCSQDAPATMQASSADESSEEKQDKNRSRKILVKISGFVLAQWLLIAFGTACLFAYLFPHVAAHGGVIKSEYSIIYGAIGFIFLVSGLQLSYEKLRINAANWRLHLITQGISFVIIPVIVFIIVQIILAADGLQSGAIDTSILVGLVAVACFPTTIASNVVMTRAAGGDDAAAIIEVIIGNVLGAFVSPGLVYAFLPTATALDGWRPASPSTLAQMYGDTAKQLGLSVLLPLAAGQAVRCSWRARVDWALGTFHLAKVAGLCLALLVWSTFPGAFETGALYKLPKTSIIFLVFMNIGLYVLFTLICFYTARPPVKVADFVNRHLLDSRLGRRLPAIARKALTVKRMSREETIAVCFCGAAKSAAIGISLVEAMWMRQSNLTRAYILIPVVLYTIEQVFMAQILVYVFKRYWTGKGGGRGGFPVVAEAPGMNSR